MISKEGKLEIMMTMVKELKENYAVDIDEEWRVFFELIKEKNIDHLAIENYLYTILAAKFEKPHRQIEPDNVFKGRNRGEERELREQISEENSQSRRHRRSSVSRDRSRKSESIENRVSVSGSKSKNSQKSAIRGDSYTSINSIDSSEEIKSKRNIPSNFNSMNYKIAFLENDQDIFVPDDMIAADEMTLISSIRDLVKNLEKNDTENFRVKKPLARSLMNINRRNRRNHNLRRKDMAINCGKGRSKSRNMNEFR